MDLTPYLSTLREDLATAAAAGDDDTRRTAAMLSAALEPAARLALMNALSDLAAEVTAALDDRIVEVRLDGRDVQVVVSHTGSPADDDHPGPTGSAQSGPGAEPTGDISRITLRLFEELKTKAEDAAAAQGVSLNSWVSQAVQGALQGRGRGPWGHGPHGHGPWGQGGGWSQDWQERQKGRPGSRLRGWVQG